MSKLQRDALLTRFEETALQDIRFKIDTMALTIRTHREAAALRSASSAVSVTSAPPVEAAIEILSPASLVPAPAPMLPVTNAEIEALRRYETNIIRAVNELKRIDEPTPQQITTFFTTCRNESTTASNVLNANRTWPTTILDFMKDVANFCIKYLSMLARRDTPQFFNTTTKPIDAVRREIAKVEKDMAALENPAPAAHVAEGPAAYYSRH